MNSKTIEEDAEEILDFIRPFIFHFYDSQHSFSINSIFNGETCRLYHNYKTWFLKFDDGREYIYNSVDKTYKEIASGMNDSRKELVRMLDAEPTIIIVEHKDRLTRFGFNYIELLLKKQGCEVLLLNKEDIDENDLMTDMISIVTSFCCRLYGKRRGLNKSKNIQEIVNT